MTRNRLHTVTRPHVLGAAAIAFAALTASATASAADTLSPGDQAFVAKVSQGGMFEVAASKVAVEQAQAQEIKDMASTEVHDHESVGAKLKDIASKNGDDFPTDLNADFTHRIDALKALKGKAFDMHYTAEMRRIHAADGAAFAKEATAAKNPDLKAFAAETSGIVKMHIGAWKAATQ